MKPKALTITALVFLTGCQASIDADVLIENGAVFIGDDTPAKNLSIAIKNDKVVYVGPPRKTTASQTIDASGLYVIPGFIDPHTHSLSELTNKDAEIRENRNYQFQGVTTVVNGNDGYGEPNISEQMENLKSSGIGTNTALFIGHGALRKSVMGGDKREPTLAELEVMKSKISDGMAAGALGLSTGLFYAPGSFSNTDEIISLRNQLQSMAEFTIAISEMRQAIILD